MANLIDYALLAGASYVSTRADLNKFPVPAPWTQVSYSPPKPSGFEAAAFGNGATLAESTEVVISYAGTGPGWADWFHANIPAALGMLADQLREAADYYLAVKASVPEGTAISLTGHSLGGGLASLIAVMFGESAFTFDQAPFRNAALAYPDTDAYGMSTVRSAAKDLRAYLAGTVSPGLLDPLDAYIAAAEPFASPDPADTLAGREARVVNINVQGEALSIPPASWLSRIGSQADIPDSVNGVSDSDLHAQSLLTAFLQSNATAEPFKNLADVTFKLPELLKMIFDKDLFYNDPNNKTNPQRNLLEHLVRHEAGVRDPVTGAVQIAADAMVTRFTRDLWKIAQDGGLSVNESNGLVATYSNWNNVAKALTAFAMQMYYEDTANATNPAKELFTGVDGGIRFDIADVAKTFAAAIQNGKQIALDDAKGYRYFKDYLDNTSLLTPAERGLVRTLLPYMRDWTIQAGANGITAADGQNRGAFMLGGQGTDNLVGGNGSDLLVGNSGNDVLQGKGGNDFLLGGIGDDTYLYAGDDGLDTILDTSGHNTLTIDDENLAGGSQYGDNRVFRSADGKHLYVRPDATTLLIDGKLVVQSYGSGGDFGLTFSDPVAEADLPTLSGNAQDNFISNQTYDRDQGSSSVYQASNSTGAKPPAGLAGSDTANIIEGGAGTDIISGGGNDRLYADSRIAVAAAIAAGNSASPSGSRGDWLAGGSDDDTLVGGIGNDVLAGGGGADLLIAGAGDDDILGDIHHLATSFEWTVTDSSGYRVYDPATGIETPPDGAADVIYAGGGNDYVWAGAGNDVVFGEGGNDRMNGNEGNDIVLGGAGEDSLWGGSGHDWLDGGTENDTLYGEEGDDILIGGTGNDTMYGGAGRDTYIINKGDGIDHIYDAAAGPEASIMVFGEGVDPSKIILRCGSLLLDLGDGDAVHIDSWNQDDPLANPTVESFQFADGTSLTWSELLARGFDLDGTEGDDNLIGTGLEDRMDGLGGDDILLGLAGDDTISGGTGTDGMNGGLGDDTYIFNAGDSPTLAGQSGPQAETLVDDGGSDTVRFGDGVDPANLVLTNNGDGGLLIDYSEFGQPLDRLLIVNGQAGVIENFKIGAGSTASLSYEQFVGSYGSGTYSGTDDAGRRHVAGGKTDDLIAVDEDGAIVSGGRGDDTLYLGGNGATAVVNRGDGADQLNVTGTNAMLRFADQNADQLTVSRSGLDLLFANAGGDQVAVSGWLDNDGLDAGVQSIAFADGTVWDGNAIRAKLVTGTAGDDHLIGFAGGDAMSGGDGDDRLEGRGGDATLDGGTGDDRLDGGAGDDTLAGGAGADIYVFAPGSGSDTVIDGGAETNVLRFESWQSASGLRALREGDDLALVVRGTADSVMVKDYYTGSPQSWSVDFGGANAVTPGGLSFKNSNRWCGHAKSRRWRYGEPVTTATNDATWRRAA